MTVPGFDVVGHAGSMDRDTKSDIAWLVLTLAKLRAIPIRIV
jgi:hypothetical protein